MSRDTRSTRAAAAWSAVAVTTTLLAVALVSAPRPTVAIGKGDLVTKAMQAKLDQARQQAARTLVNPASRSSAKSGH